MSTQTVLRRAADAFAAPHGLDRFVELAVPTWSTGEVRARVVEVRRTTPSSVTLALRPNRNWTGFRAGQHTQLTVEIGGVRHTRCYSLASSEHRTDGLIELTVKAHPHGVVSGHLIRTARAGMVVGLSQAQGAFTLPSTRPDRLLLVSGGSGITPVMSMLRTLRDEGYAGEVRFVHYAANADEHIYRDEAPGIYGRIFDPADIGDIDLETYVCGPAPMMDLIRAHYQGRGLADRYHDEAFTAAIPTSEASGGIIRFGASNRDVVDDGRAILLQAEAAGLNPESGCRMGICHTCTRQLTCGAVRNLTTGEVSPSGSAIRICVSAPVGDIELEL